MQFDANGIHHEWLGDGFDDAQLRRIFADTPAMLAFFADKAGVAYPHRTYSQALVADTVGQELAGMALVSEVYGREVLEERFGGMYRALREFVDAGEWSQADAMRVVDLIAHVNAARVYLG